MEIRSNVLSFGAKGDGVTKDTQAIQKALDAGGVVHFPAGTYLTGTIYLRSNGGIDLAPGAVILGSPDLADYNSDDFCPQNIVFKRESVTGAHLVVAVEQQNIVITGHGRIDGNRQAFYTPETDRSKIWSTELTRPGQMVYLCECEDVAITGVELFNAPYWTCFLHGCEHVQIQGVHIFNHMHTRNGDGIDLDCCRFVTVSDCRIDCGDDCITLRGNNRPLKKPRPCEYITITNCILRTICNAFRIGVGNGLVRSATISNCIIFDSRNAITLCSKYSQENGVGIEDISFSNIRIDAIKPFVIVINAHGHKEGPAIQPIRNISFNQVRGRCKEASVIVGEKPGDISEITFNDVVLDYYGGETVRTDITDFTEVSGRSAPAAFWCAFADDVHFNACGINWDKEAVNWQYDIIAHDCANLTATNCRFTKGIDNK